MYHATLYNLTTPWMYIKALFLPKSLYLLDYTIRYLLNLLIAGFAIIFYLTHRENNRYDISIGILKAYDHRKHYDADNIIDYGGTHDGLADFI